MHLAGWVLARFQHRQIERLDAIGLVDDGVDAVRREGVDPTLQRVGPLPSVVLMTVEPVGQPCEPLLDVMTVPAVRVRGRNLEERVEIDAVGPASRAPGLKPDLYAVEPAHTT